MLIYASNWMFDRSLSYFKRVISLKKIFKFNQYTIVAKSHFISIFIGLLWLHYMISYKLWSCDNKHSFPSVKTKEQTYKYGHLRSRHSNKLRLNYDNIGDWSKQ